ncbi:hypothetical protein GF406_20290 [candidate division KSB1 bacterium]|jgi:hypothetical protein|nr:hypothetical protein [candidate division KSB1 bacterium]
MFCHNCGTEISIERKIFRQDTCPKCSAYLRCCLHCKHYDINAHHECRESEATWVHDKEMANFCDYFVLDEEKKGGSQASRSEQARKKLDELFKKPPRD